MSAPIVNLVDGANPSGGHADSVKLDEQFLGGAFAENIFDHLVDFFSFCTRGRPFMDGRGEGVGSEPAGEHEHRPGHQRPDYHHQRAVLEDLFVEAVFVDAMRVREDQRAVG